MTGDVSRRAGLQWPQSDGRDCNLLHDVTGFDPETCCSGRRATAGTVTPPLRAL